MFLSFTYLIVIHLMSAFYLDLVSFVHILFNKKNIINFVFASLKHQIQCW